MIKVGSVFKAKNHEGYRIKILKKEGNQYRVHFIGPPFIQQVVPKVIDVVSEKYIRDRYIING